MVQYTSPSGPALQVRFPPTRYFSFPSSKPASLPPPSPSDVSPTLPAWAQPFRIPQELFTRLLDARVPITIAGVYAVTVVIVNQINKRRGYRPWAISKTRVFRWLVILHNVFLAVYSAWTCKGMFEALRNSLPPLWGVSEDGEGGLVAVVDAFCKINGPRGLGNGALYDSAADQWVLPNPAHRLASNGEPDPTDVGRMWNQGLAYYGWLFYLSKFYEVVDTAIILAKGKRSSTLQTYHHAGAMMCMWAGIRYMGQPIWIFVQFNSFIHALMYTYYTMTALSIRVPRIMKRTLTSMQITQFVVGTFAASIYLFIRYSIPVPASSASKLQNLVSGLFPFSESGVATASAGFLPWLKKLAFRAAGAEGLAENVRNAQGQPFGADALQTARYRWQQQAHRVDYHWVDCVDTPGQSFAIWLNVMYLLPLTYLFCRFFVRSYLQRKEPAVPAATVAGTQIQLAEQAGRDALKGVSREIRMATMKQNGEEDVSGTEEELAAGDEQSPQEKDEEEENGSFSAVPRKRRAKRSKAASTPEETESVFPSQTQSQKPIEQSNVYGVLKDDSSS